MCHRAGGQLDLQAVFVLVTYEMGMLSNEHLMFLQVHATSSELPDSRLLQQVMVNLGTDYCELCLGRA